MICKGLEPEFFSTSQGGEKGPDVGVDAPSAMPTTYAQLATHDAIVSCQGGDYTKQVLPGAARVRLARRLD